MTELYPRVERAQGLVIASPTYHYTVTPEIKAFIDRLYPYYDFQEPRPGPYRARLAGQGRAVVPVGICEQNDPADMRYTIPVMRDALEAIGYEPMAEVAITGHFYRATVGDDATVAMMVRDAADRMTERLAG